MARLKQPQDNNAKTPPSSHSNAAGSADGWKWKVFSFIAFLVLLAIIWCTPFFQDLIAGPKTPLPRQVSDLSLGMKMGDVLQKYPDLKKKLRSYNNDPLFQIATLSGPSDPTGPSTLDLLFFKDQLYYVSAMWEAGNAKSVPVDQWAKQYRRWNHNTGQDMETLGSQAVLKEWHFDDKKTEMTLRDLVYSDQLKRWEDIRDASNNDAQSAFSKYRLETGS